MLARDRVIVVTGGAQGIGAALCRGFHAEGAKGVTVADLDEAAAERLAREIGGLAVGADVTDEAQVQRIVALTEERFGPVDIFCSNAGTAPPESADGWPSSTPNEHWQKSWEVHVMAHIYAARAVLPGMIARGEGYLVSTASAAGLLNQVDYAAYATTKHGAVALAEALAIAHGDQGIRVSVVCPQAVDTKLFNAQTGAGPEMGAADGILDADTVAERVLEGIREERFLIVPHPETLTYFQRKAADYDRWIRGMRRARAKFAASGRE
jgi:NAD(P)-dependent dehydrogenase (short-subunit alcohol dehydrogenase family)